MAAKGERARRGGYRRDEPATVADSSEKTTDELAEEMGMSPRTYQGRHRIGRGITEETGEILDDIDTSQC
jgi:NTP pyrophosphatase (non-canonical NTP hydrolase)